MVTVARDCSSPTAKHNILPTAAMHPALPQRVINCLADNTPRAAARPPIADTQADNRRG